MRVLVTDGDARAALAVVRSLGRLGHDVLVGERRPGSLAHASRYCAERIVYPDPAIASDAFIDTVANVVRARHVDTLLPVADIATFLVTSHRDRFPCDIPLASADVIERAANKVDILQTAERLGLPVPRYVLVTGPSHVPEVDLLFPLVIKPWRSRVQTPQGWTALSVSYAADRDELLRDLASRSSHEFPVLLQERIVGPGLGVFAFYDGGRPVALFSHRRLRERPPWGGVSVLSESIEMCPRAREYATRLLEDIGWRGAAMVEFKRDVRDGLPKLMEINGRFWGSLQLAVDAGVDFPALVVQRIGPRACETQAPYRVGVRSRWFWGDVDSLLATLFGAPQAPRWAKRGSRLRAVIAFARLWGCNLFYDNPKWDDPWPWFVETSDRITHVARRVWTRPSS